MTDWHEVVDISRIDDVSVCARKWWIYSIFSFQESIFSFRIKKSAISPEWKNSFNFNVGVMKRFVSTVQGYGIEWNSKWTKLMISFMIDKVWWMFKKYPQPNRLRTVQCSPNIWNEENFREFIIFICGFSLWQLSYDWNLMHDGPMIPHANEHHHFTLKAARVKCSRMPNKQVTMFLPLSWTLVFVVNSPAQMFHDQQLCLCFCTD